MKQRKRIALFVGQAEEAYQSRFISGFLKESFAEDFDVCIFSMYRKYQDTSEREQGESNIFYLMEPSAFDGAVILKDSIQTEKAAEQLELHLKKVFNKPTVVIEKESDLFPSICTDCYSAEYELITHLIEEHYCRDIVFVSGKKWHKHSRERLQAYRDAMRDHDIPVSEDNILYGDFWYQSGELCAEQILFREQGLPDAIACANDQMAIGVCKVLTANGIKVPDDIAVVGYDSIFEGQTCPRSLTSALIPSADFGEYAFRFLMAEMKGNIPSSFKLRPGLIYGESCGCTESGMPFYRIKRDEWGTDISEESYNSVFNMLDENLISQTSLQEYLDTVYSYAYQLRGAREFHLCICSDWRHISPSLHVPHEGYPGQMIHAIRYCSDHRHNIADTEQLFSTSEMLPELNEERENPAAYFFTPFFFEKDCFGYAVISYGSEPRSYDEIYRRWIGSVCRGFEIVRRNIILKQMHEHNERMKNSKFLVSNHAFENLEPDEKAKFQLVSHILDDNLLDYHFQPIIKVEDGEIYAYEALMRSRTDTSVSPLSIIKYAAMQERLSDVERATFLNVMRIIDENHERFGDARVFINSIPGVPISDSDAAALEHYLTTYSDKVVVELTEESELKDHDLKRLKSYFSRMNIDIAVDDYGTGYSNVSNLLRYMPNYVKIDRSLLSGIQNQMQKQHFVREIVDFCHDNDILALAEGVETSEELQTVIHLGVDLIQGFYTAKPSADIIGHISEKSRNEIKQYYQERIDGQAKKLYIAGKTNRISLAKLEKEGCTDIIVGCDGMVYKDVFIVGTPQMKTEIHLRVEADYCGRITLEDAFFSNIKNRPCIELGENTDVTLSLCGSNSLIGGGIKVPESARLVIEDDGDLHIELNSAETYGIGNDLSSGNGEIIFDQDGLIDINCRGKKCVCIGSGQGGTIQINRGSFTFCANTETCVAVGATDGSVSMNIFCCNIEAILSVNDGLMIGSLNNNADISVKNSSVKFKGSGMILSCIGSLHGKKAAVKFAECGFTADITGTNSTCIGSLYGSSDIRVDFLTLRITNSGQKALIYGGYNPDTVVALINADTNSSVQTSLGKDTFAPPENFRVVNGRHLFMVNDYEVAREAIVDYK